MPIPVNSIHRRVALAVATIVAAVKGRLHGQEGNDRLHGGSGGEYHDGGSGRDLSADTSYYGRTPVETAECGLRPRGGICDDFIAALAAADAL